MNQKQFRIAIARKGVSQIRCARDLGWSHSRLNYFVKGYYVPSHSEQEKLSTYLGIPVETLFGDETQLEGGASNESQRN